ncbi:MAG: response regulator [Candidatus Hydrogenedens sp.]|nr:response regulator [Candidatus Hydrogenedens sp.]
MATVLCIDHDDQYGQFISTQLKNSGHQCVFSHQGAKAIPLAEKHEADLIISEVMLPDVCGFEIARRIRVHEKLRMLPIILMSTMCEEDEVRHALAQGIDGFLPKPFNGTSLMTMISQHLAEARSLQVTDPVTGLSGQKQIRAEIQKAIVLKQKFATLYIEITGLAHFARTHGEATRDKLLRHFVKILEHCRKKLSPEIFHAGHFGNGHFFSLIEADKASSMGEHLQKYWKSFLEKDIASITDGSSPTSKEDGKVMLDLIIYLTGNTILSKRTPQEYFETLAQLRKKQRHGEDGGIVIDNRRGF